MKPYKLIKPIKAAQYKGSSYSDAEKFCKENDIPDKRWTYHSWDHCKFVILNNIFRVKEYLHIHQDFYVVENVDFFRNRNTGDYDVYTESEFIELYEEA